MATMLLLETHCLSIDKKHAAGGAPYKDAKHFPTDKCLHPPITAYHKLAAPGPCMGRTFATWKGCMVAMMNLKGPLTFLQHNCRVTHFICLEENAHFIYLENVLVITVSPLFKARFLLVLQPRYATCSASVM